MSLPREITVHELVQWLGREPRPTLLDVRDHDEFQWARLPGARLIPLDELPERLDELEALKGQPVVVYCHLGVRSLAGAELLRELGVEATSLRGGIEAWSTEIDPSVPRY